MGRAADYRTNGGYDAWERSADYVLVPLALIFLAVLLIPLVVHLTPQEQAAFLVANILIWVAFAVDYFVRLYLAPARGRFVRTHVLDFIVVCVPFLRPLRLLRVIGIIGEYVVRSRRHLARRAMAFVGVVAVVALLAGAAVIYNSERTHAPSLVSSGIVVVGRSDYHRRHQRRPDNDNRTDCRIGDVHYWRRTGRDLHRRRRHVFHIQQR
jgi:hypothetical protein